MVTPPYGLTEKECEALQLLVEGYDIKSAAHKLGISVNTLNDRLREARRKTEASSSREAARRFAANHAHTKSVPPETGVVSEPYLADQASEGSQSTSPGLGSKGLLTSSVARGGLILVFIAAVLALGSALMDKLDQPDSGSPPVVVATNPQAGTTVDPGETLIRVTFDRPMRAGSYSFVQRSPETYPDCGDNQPTQSEDKRSFTLKCNLESGRNYEIWFNSERYANFVSTEGLSATPYALRFKTN